MATTIEHLYDPLDPDYWDAPTPAPSATARSRSAPTAASACKFCPSFKDLFRMIDADESAGDVSVLTDDEHKQVVDECYQCKLCYVACPYTPDQEQEWKIDFPRLMLRSLSIQAKQGEVQRGARLLARTDLQGRVATALSGMVNRTNDFKPVRFLMEKTTGIARDRLLPSFANVRFSKWFTSRQAALRSDAATTNGGALPDVSRRVPGPRDRQGDGRGLRAQRHRLRPARRSGVLRDAVARRG